MVYSRRESIMTTTKRHPARMVAKIGAMRDGRLAAMDFSADFNTGAYASWGPTVANRVPVHASGPVPHASTTGRGRGQSTRISCLPALFEVSACRRAQSHKSNSTTSLRFV